jgi:large subunit ribosomal protein L29
MHIQEIRDMATEQILDALEDMKVEMYTYRIQRETGELSDTTMFRKIRHDIARIKTVLRERELAAEMVSGEEGS